MWESVLESIAGGRGERYVLKRAGVAMSYGEVVESWRWDGEFRAYFAGVLARSRFDAFRWETPGVTAETMGRAFEFVLLEAPGLVREAESGAFARQFEGTRRGVVAFENLGRDAVLVVPCPAGGVAESTYVHLAAFVRGGPAGQVDELWRVVGEEMAGQVGRRPRWLSTAGMGVAWLHVRIDSTPKYYGYEAYR